MELTIKLEDSADLLSLKIFLLQYKGVKSVEVSDSKTHSWEEIEASTEFTEVIEKGRNQIKNCDHVEHSQELMDSIFKK